MDVHHELKRLTKNTEAHLALHGLLEGNARSDENYRDDKELLCHLLSNVSKLPSVEKIDLAAVERIFV